MTSFLTALVYMMGAVMLTGAVEDSQHRQLYNFSDAAGVHAVVQSHLTFTVPYKLNDEKKSTSHLTFSLWNVKPKVGGVVQNETSVHLSVAWDVTDKDAISVDQATSVAMGLADNETTTPVGNGTEKDVVTFTMIFEKDGAAGKGVILKSATLNVPVINNKILRFNKDALLTGKTITAEFATNNLKIQNDEKAACYKCSTNTFEGVMTPALPKLKAKLVMAHTWMQAFLPDKEFSKDLKVCARDAKVATGVGSWQLNVTDTKPPKMCLLFTGELTMVLNYKKQHDDSNQTTTGVAKVPVPKDAKIDIDRSHCGNASKGESAILALKFFNNAWTLRLTFTNQTGQQFVLKTVDIDATVGRGSMVDSYFPDRHDEPLKIAHMTPQNTSYPSVGSKTGTYLVCHSAQTLRVDADAQLDASSLTVKALVDPDAKPLTPELCKADVRTSNLIPIIVGGCLALLVVVVLAAYLIGRHRARRNAGAGYASV